MSYIVLAVLSVTLIRLAIVYTYPHVPIGTSAPGSRSRAPVQHRAKCDWLVPKEYDPVPGALISRPARSHALAPRCCELFNFRHARRIRARRKARVRYQYSSALPSGQPSRSHSA